MLRVCVRSVRVWNVRVTSSACIYQLLWWVRALCALTHAHCAHTLRTHTLSTRPHTQVLVNISLFLVLSLFPLYCHWREKGEKRIMAKTWGPSAVFPCIDEENKKNRNKIGAKVKTLEAEPFDQNAKNWKRENRLFTSTVLEAGASGAKSNRNART